MAKSILERLRSLSAVHRKRIDTAEQVVKNMKLIADEAIKVGKEAKGETE